MSHLQCSLKFALEGIDPMSLALIDREMKERYYDAKEWVTIQNGLIPAENRDEWRMFRIRKSQSKTTESHAPKVSREAP